MQTSRQPGSEAAAGAAAARKAGALLILTAAASLVAVGARVSADADQPTLAESLAAISESRASTASAAQRDSSQGLR